MGQIMTTNMTGYNDCEHTNTVYVHSSNNIMSFDTVSSSDNSDICHTNNKVHSQHAIDTQKNTHLTFI